MRVDVVEREGEDAGALRRGRRAVERQPVDGAQAIERVGGQVALVGADGLHAERGQVVGGDTEGDRVAGARRAGLELVRQVGVSGPFQRDPLDHRAAAVEGRHRLQDRPLAPEDADPHRAEHLVPGEGQEVAAEVADVHRPVRHALRPVHQRQRPDRPRPIRDLAHRVDRAEGVGDVSDGDQLHALAVPGQQAVVGLQVEPPLVGDGDRLDQGTALLRHDLPRH